jgi:hypothetical protein
MTSRSIVVVSAGLSQPSSTRLLADRLAVATVEDLRGRGATSDVQVIELRDHARDLVDHLLTGFPSPKLRAAIDHVLGADALIAVTPIFNASYSGLFKLFFDVLERDSLSGLPVLIGATGARLAIRWRSITPSGRCSRISTPESCRPRCMPRHRTGVRTRPPNRRWPIGSTVPRGNWPARSSPMTHVTARIPSRRRPRSRICCGPFARDDRLWSGRMMPATSEWRHPNP